MRNSCTKLITFVGVVRLDVPYVVPGEFVDGLLDLGQSAVLSHLLRGKVGVRARSTPLPLKHWFPYS